MTPDDRRFTREHEWVSNLDDGTVRIGITDFAQDALGDVVFVALPDVGTVLSAGDACGEVESTKSVSELYAPVSGEIVRVNAALTDAPETVNSDPYGAGWMVEVRPSEPPTDLLGSAEYRGLIGEG